MELRDDTLWFDALWKAHAPHLHKYLRWLGVRDEHLEDVVQDVFLCALQDSYDPARALARTWLRGIAEGRARTYLRSAARHERKKQGPRNGKSAHPDSYLESRDAWRKGCDAIGRLDDRAIFVSRWLLDMTTAAIAAERGMSPSAIDRALQRALHQFREAVGAPMQDRNEVALPASVAALIANEKSAAEPSAAQLDRGWARLREAIVARVFPANASPGTRLVRSVFRSGWARLAAGFGGGILVGANLRPPISTPDAPILTEVRTVPPVAPVASAPAPVPPVPPAPPPPRVPARAAPPKAPAVVSSASAVVDTLSLERALLDQGRTAIVRGEPSSALTLLGEHERRFPDGKLAEERDALYVEALASAGRESEASTRAERFRRDHPASLLLPAVDAAVRRR